MAERSQDATQRVLDRLVGHGIVLSKEAGRARVYELNREHLAAESISDLAHLRLALFSRLEYFLDIWQVRPLHASVFGSAARGDGGVDSDIDIFLVRPSAVDEDDEDWRRQLDVLAKVVFEWTGNHAGIAEVAEEDLERLRFEQPSIVESLRSDAVDIVGVPSRSLLRDA